MFNYFKEKFTKVYTHFTSKVQELFNRPTFDQATLEELSKILLAADAGTTTTNFLISSLQSELQRNRTTTGIEAKKILEKQLITLLPSSYNQNPSVILLVGINGSGKTTSAGKLAYYYQQQGKRVLLVAADTFRAAAVEQLAEWAKRSGATFFSATMGQDPSSVVFTACKKFRLENFDILIVDTAGRLQTKLQLMQELEKIKRTIHKQLPKNITSTLLVIDAMLGQNSLQQARIFHEATTVDGIILTKLDGTAKGGIIFAIAQELKIPVAYITTGEHLSHLEEFNASAYVQGLFQ